MITQMKRIALLFLLLSEFGLSSAQNLNVLSGQSVSVSNQSITYQTITINSGAQLQINNSNITMLKDGRITVKPGGRLLLSKTVIGPQSNNYWEGILVEGNPTLAQTPTSNQGFVNVTTSTISGAKVGLSTKSLNSQGDINWSNSGGGIIIMSKSTVKNCKSKHLEFFSYKNKSGNKEISNQSRFTECLFNQTNIKYPIVQVNPSNNPQVLSTYSTPFIITAWGVKGLAFRGCTFYGGHPVNTQDPYDYQKAFHSPSGIFSYDASIIVENIKPLTNTVNIPTKFMGLNVAIANYFSSINDYMSNINNCIFYDVEVGISQNGGTGSMIYRNTFWLNKYASTTPYQATNISFPGKKIITDNAVGLKIAENIFARDPNGLNPTEPLLSTLYATVMNNSDRSLVVANTPTSEYILNINSYGLNTLQAQKDNSKLKVTCNTFNGGGYGWVVNGQMNFNPVSTTSKPPTFGNCIGEKTDYNNIFGNLQQNQAEIYNYTTNTPALNYVVKPNLLYRPVQAKCLNMITTSCDGNVSSTQCNSNLPSEPGSSLPTLDFDPSIFVKIKDSIVIFKTQLSDSTLSQSERENSLAFLNFYEKQASSLMADKIRYHQYMQLFDDETIEHLNELIMFLGSENDLFCKMMLAGIYINNGNTSQAQAVLNNITETDNNTIAYKNLCAILIQLQISERNIFMLTEEEYNTIYSIASGESSSAQDAQGILGLTNGEIFSKHIEKYPGIDSINTLANQLSENEVNMVSVYPNPAASGDLVTVSYKVNTSSTNKTIKVYDFFGNLLTQTAISGSDLEGQVTINVTDFDMGLYIVRLVIDDQTVANTILSYSN